MGDRHGNLKMPIWKLLIPFGKTGILIYIKSKIVQESCEVKAGSSVIKDYLADKYGPSCLIFGLTKSHSPIHIQCSYPSRKVAKIITLYQPELEEWIDYKLRRK